MSRIRYISFRFMMLLVVMASSESSVISVSAAGIISDLRVSLNTNLACYAPGQPVEFTAVGDVPANAVIRYRQGINVIEETSYAVSATDGRWRWTPPSTDFRGYMVDIYYKDGSRDVVLGSIAVDVSSDWKRFPRYGFVADFEEYGDNAAKSKRIVDEIAWLNRCHINGVQFQDWQWKHHYPVCFNADGSLKDWYQDISNRYVGTEHVRHYISEQHKYGMKSIFYNLCFGAWKDKNTGELQDGVKPEWGLFAYDGSGNRYQDFHGLPDDWASNIYIQNPSNSDWLKYIGDRTDEVYANFDFDGYQIDQLGNRGDRYDYNGNRADLPSGYAMFINNMKERRSDKSLVMNAVSGYGDEQICRTGKVDFCYNEVWGNGNGYGGASEDSFDNLYDIIKRNDRFSDYTLQTVFAAYMNYDKAGEAYKYPEDERIMNTPGVLLTDAVMFALGGSHLELGSHMLSREYFPAAPLAMTDELKTAIEHYYDFMTAYQNLLRDNSSKFAFTADVTTTAGVDIKAWPPKENTVVTYAKNVGMSQVVHLINFLDIDNLSWRDVNGTRKEPPVKENMPISVKSGRKISRVWLATPDVNGGVAQEVEFIQNGDRVELTVPSLKYWTMVVLESDSRENRMLVVGDATDTGWDTNSAMQMDSYENGSVFRTTMMLEAGDGKNFKFVNGYDYGTCVSYNAEYEDYNFNNSINTANIMAHTNIDFDNGETDYKFTVAETGVYDIEINLNTMRIRVDKAADGAVVNIGRTGYATYCSNKALSFDATSELKAYIATGTAEGNNGVLRLIVQCVTDVPAFTGLLLHGTPGAYVIPYGSTTAVYLNMFRGVTEPTEITSGDDNTANFVLADGDSGMGFYPAADGTLPANRAYLSLPKQVAAAAKMVSIDFNGDVTSIDVVQNRADEITQSYYTLTGLRAKQPLKPGVYVHCGRKVVVR